MEDEEWEDVLVVSFVYPTDAVAGPQTPGGLVSFKRRLKASYQAIEVPSAGFQGKFYECFRSPSNHLVMLTFSAPCLRVFDRQMKPVQVDMNSLDYYSSFPYLFASSDYKSVGMFHFDHDRNKYNLVIYNVEKNTFRACLEICGVTFQIWESRKKLNPFQFLNLHTFTAEEAFFFSDSLDYIRIDLGTGQATVLFNLRTVDHQSAPHPDPDVPQRPGNLSLMLTNKNKSYTVSTANKHVGLPKNQTHASSYIFINQIQFAGDQTLISLTKVCKLDELLTIGRLEPVKEGFVVAVPKNTKSREILLVKPTPSLSQGSGELRDLKLIDSLEDRDAGLSSNLISFNQWRSSLGGYTFGFFGWGRSTSTKIKGTQGSLYLKLWVLSRGKFHTHQLAIHGFGRGWEVLQLGPGVRSAGNHANPKKVQFLISLGGTGKDNKDKVVRLLSTLELRN